MRTCTAEGCVAKHKGHGLCSKHLRRIYYARDPERIRRTNALWRHNNPDKIKKANAKWLSENPEKAKQFQHRGYLKRKHGITPEEKQQRLKNQGNKCGNSGCKNTIPGGLGCWHTDHNHETGQLRGELCHGCNTSLGHLGEDTERIVGLVEYLRKWKEADG